MWKELRNDHVDDGFVYIDAWESEDDNEEGKVIAKINIQTQEVEYLDFRARSNASAHDIIAETLCEIRKGNYE